MRNLFLVMIALHVAALVALLNMQMNARAQSMLWPRGESAAGGRLQSTKLVGHAVLAPAAAGLIPRTPLTHW